MSAMGIRGCVCLAVFVLLGSAKSSAQFVYFDNALLVPYIGEVNALVYESPQGRPLTGTNYVAQLYYGTSVTSLVAAAGAPARFRPPTTSSPGTWIGQERTLPGLSVGSLAVLAVRIWDITQAPTFEEAVARDTPRIDCGPFYYEVKPLGLHPTNYFMFEFRARIGGAQCPPPPYVPWFETQPQSQTVRRGDTIRLSPMVVSDCLHQWRFNGQIVGFHETLVISNAQPSHTGSYQLIASSYGGSVTSQVANIALIGEPRLSSITHSGGQFVFEIPANHGETFVIETATHVSPTTTWTPVTTNTAPFAFTNSAATDRQRFYRTVLR